MQAADSKTVKKYNVLLCDQDRAERVNRGDAWDSGLFPETIDWESDNLRAFWNSRRFQCHMDSYRGVQMVKFPEDLRTYEHVLWETKPEVIVEIGVHVGGSALWFTDRLRTLYHHMKWAVNNPLYVGLDIGLKWAREACKDESGVVLIEGDAADHVAEVEKWVSGRRCMVIEDSEHGYANTKKMLEAYHKLVSPGCYFVVEDTWVDQQELLFPGEPLKGCGVAAREFVNTHPEFDMLLMSFYGITCNQFGWLKRKETP